MNTIINLLKKRNFVKCITVTGKNREYKKADISKLQIGKRENFICHTRNITCLSNYFSCVKSEAKRSWKTMS